MANQEAEQEASEQSVDEDEICRVAGETALEKWAENCGDGALRAQAAGFLGISGDRAEEIDPDQVLADGIDHTSGPSEVREWVLARVFGNGPDGRPLLGVHDNNIMDAIDAAWEEADGHTEPPVDPEPEPEPQAQPDPEPETVPDPDAGEEIEADTLGDEANLGEDGAGEPEVEDTPDTVEAVEDE